MIHQIKVRIRDMAVKCAISSAGHKIFLSLIVLLVFQGQAIADMEKDWKAFSRPIEKFEKKKDCQSIWNYLWPKAKAGDKDARFVLLTLIISWPHFMSLTMPGHQSDLVSTTRDGIIMGMHSAGTKFVPNFSTKEQTHPAIDILRELLNQISGQKFLACLKQKDSNLCIEEAVEINLIPSFEDYAKEIDTLVAAGYQPQCSFPPEDRMDVPKIGPSEK